MAIVLDGNLGITTPSETNTGTLSVTGVTTLTGGLNAALPVLSGGTGVTTKTGTGAVVLGTSPTITGATITVAATAAPAFSAYVPTNTQTLTTSTFTKIQFSTEEFDTNSNYDNVTNYRFTPTVSGYYQVNLTVGLVGAVTGFTLVSIFKNGLRFKDGTIIPNSSMDPISVASSLIYFNGTTDYVEGFGYQSTGATKTVNVNLGSAGFFQASMVRSA